MRLAHTPIIFVDSLLFYVVIAAITANNEMQTVAKLICLLVNCRLASREHMFGLLLHLMDNTSTFTKYLFELWIPLMY